MINSRPKTTLALALTAAIAAGVSAWFAAPLHSASQAPVDKTGLDILCSGKGDVYSPPPKNGGVSSCIFADGQVMTCDSATDKCQVKRDAKGPATINADAMTLRMLKELSDRVDRLSAQVQALSAARK